MPIGHETSTGKFLKVEEDGRRVVRKGWGGEPEETSSQSQGSLSPGGKGQWTGESRRADMKS
jgi:hypothetical protein